MAPERYFCHARAGLQLVALFLILAAPPAPGESAGSAYRDAALDAARWLEATAIETPHGLTWPWSPGTSDETATDLYRGTPGIVLFFIELARVTDEERYLAYARAAADHLDNALRRRVRAEDRSLDKDENLDFPGLYVGVSGLVFAFNETYRATGDPRYRDAALLAIGDVHAMIARTDEEAEWQQWPDVLFGTAGTGLAMLYAGREMGHAASIDVATRIGRQLLQSAETHETGIGWRLMPDYQRLMPNFSHGTAGVSYFLAALYEVTGDREFLDGALAGVERLLSIADTDGEVCLIFHHTAGGEDRHYLSWCHGPAGTARTFYKLWQVTGDEQWLAWMKRSARGVLVSGIPEQRTPGFWNNVSQCCGSAGVAEFFLGLHAVTGDARYLAFAQRVADDVLARKTVTDEGSKWIQAEHRVQPDLLMAQTGYMQGAAGIGLMLLHVAAVSDGQPLTRIEFPDWPFGTVPDAPDSPLNIAGN